MDNMWDKLVKAYADSQKQAEEMEILAQPSIMDEYVKNNDPEQWNKIAEARRKQEAIGLGLSLAGSTNIPSKAKLAALEDIVNNYKTTGMFREGGESIPARELQLPNISREKSSASRLEKFPNLKELMGTSIGQGESIRQGDIPGAYEAVIRAIRYQRRQPKIKFPD